MICPICKGDTRVSKSKNNGEIVIRHRKCLECNHSFKTNETISDGWSKEYYKKRYEEVVESIKKLAVSF